MFDWSAEAVVSLIDAVFSHAPGNLIVAFGAYDHQLLAGLLRTSKDRIIWLSPNEEDSRAIDEPIRHASKSDRLLFLIGSAETTLPMLRSQLVGQTVTLLFAGSDHVTSVTPGQVQSVTNMLESFTGHAPGIVLSARRNEKATQRMAALRSALPAHTQAALATTGDEHWLVSHTLAPASFATSNSDTPSVPFPIQEAPEGNTCFCDGGLANRLNALLFCLILRHRYGHDWRISWQRNNWCGASFGSLFESDLPVVERSLSYFKERESDYWFAVHENQGNFDPSRVTFHPTLTDYAAYESLLNRHSKVCYLHHLIPSFVTLADLQSALAGLRVRSHLVTTVAEFCREHAIDRSVIGLHIRKTDFGNTVDDGELFRLVSQNPNRFFVCSDDAAVTERFSQLRNCHVLEKKHYPEKLIADAGWNSWTVDAEGRQFPFNVQRSEDAIVEALLDLLILSRTTPMMASHSTFFRMALIFNKISYFDMQEKWLGLAG